jgi:hypothetical protein
VIDPTPGGNRIIRIEAAHRKRSLGEGERENPNLWNQEVGGHPGARHNEGRLGETIAGHLAHPGGGTR